MRLSRRRWLTCLVGLALGWIGVLLVASAAGADGGNCANRYSTSHVGMVSSYQATIFGGRGRIEPANPDLCGSGGSNSWSGAYTLLSAKSATYPGNSLANGIAQVGYADWGRTSPYSTLLGLPSGYHVFSFFTRKCQATLSCGSDLSDQIAMVAKTAPSGVQFYDVHRVASDGHIHLFAGSNEVDAMQYDTTGDWQPAWDIEYLGETKQPNDDLAGTAADPVGFHLLQKYESSGNLSFFEGLDGSWNHATTSQCACYKHEETNPDAGGQGFRIWTER